MDFLDLFFGFVGRVFLGWEPSISLDPGTNSMPTKGGHQGDPDG